MKMLTTMVFWHWWVAAMALGIVEMFFPGAFFLWLAVAAAVVGAVMLLWPGMIWELQWVLFALASVGSIVAWTAWRRKHPPPERHATLNRRGSQYVGRLFTLETSIVNGMGKIHVDDSTWKVRGPDLPAGTQVRVVDVDGTILVVETAS